MQKPILYHMPISPQSRFAVMTAEHIGLDVEIREVDMFGGAHMNQEYNKINPIATVPALVDGYFAVFDSGLVDGDFTVFESSAIAIYLVEKYAKDDLLYPKDLRKRTKVNEILFFMGNYMFPRMFSLFVAGYSGKEKKTSKGRFNEIMRGYNTIEGFLRGYDYLVDNTLTLPDLYLWALMESIGLVIPVDAEKLPNITRWWSKMREHPCHDMNKKGAEEHVAFYRQRIEQGKAN